MQRLSLVEPEQLQASFADVTLTNLKPVTTGVAAVYVAFVVFNLLDLPPQALWPAVISDLVVILCCVALRVACMGSALPARLSHAAGVFIGLLVAGNTLLTLALTGELFYTNYIMVIVIGLGAVLMDWRWLAAGLSPVVVAWAAVVWPIATLDDATHLSFTMLAGVTVAVIVHVSNRRNHARMLSLANKEQERTRQLDEKRRELDRALEKERELSALRAKLVAVASHEFRTPLAAISMASEMLEKYDDQLTAEQRRERLQKIRGELDRLERLVRRVLDVGKEQRGELRQRPTTFDARRVAEVLARNLIDSYGTEHRLGLRCEEEGLVVCLDEDFYRQIVANLVSNAIKFSPSGSQITIGLSATERTLTLEVSDQGCGIPEEEIEYVFEPFQRATNSTSVDGVGLGLSILREGLVARGGTIDVESVVDEGTTFSVRLPLLEGGDDLT